MPATHQFGLILYKSKRDANCAVPDGAPERPSSPLVVQDPRALDNRNLRYRKASWPGLPAQNNSEQCDQPFQHVPRPLFLSMGHAPTKRFQCKLKSLRDDPFLGPVPGLLNRTNIRLLCVQVLLELTKPVPKHDAYRRREWAVVENSRPAPQVRQKTREFRCISQRKSRLHPNSEP